MEALLTAALDEDSEAGWRERVDRHRAEQRERQTALARWLIRAAVTGGDAPVNAKIEAAAREARTSAQIASEVFWELVRLRILDAGGQLGPRARAAMR